MSLQLHTYLANVLDVSQLMLYMILTCEVKIRWEFERNCSCACVRALFTLMYIRSQRVKHKHDQNDWATFSP